MKVTLMVVFVGIAWRVLMAPAAAQTAEAEAEALFRRGKDLMERGQIAEACIAFESSQKIDPSNSTLLNAAHCREMNGQLASSWGLFLQVERLTRGARGSLERRFNRVAKDRASKLEPRLSSLLIVVPADIGVVGLEVLRDGERVDPGAWNQQIPIDGGSHTVVARAPGAAEWSATIEIAIEREQRSVELPRLAPLPSLAATRSAATAPREAARRKLNDAAPVPARRSRKAAWITGGAAVALLGGALAFELWGRAIYTDAKSETDPAK